jgi:hypothetical protein
VSADGATPDSRERRDGETDDGEADDGKAEDSTPPDDTFSPDAVGGPVDANDPVIQELRATIEALEARIGGLETQVAGLQGGSPTVAAHYHAEANQAFAPGSERPRVGFEVRDFDTHDAVTTETEWAFTAPVDGLYHVDVALALQGSGPTTNAHAELYLQSARVNYRLGAWAPVEPTLSIISFDIPLQGSGLVALAAGESLWVEVDPPGFTLSLQHDTEQTAFINIVRVGELP